MGWTYIGTIASEWSMRAVVIRMVAALFVGVIIGIDRGMKRRGAGIKTHTLVCLGATLVMVTGQYIYVNFNGTGDIARLGAQVISGVGFLGVGTIIVTGRNQVRGLTTAAGLWACACIGLAIGIGFVEGAVVTFLLVILTLNVLTRIDVLLHKYAKVFDLYIEFETNKSVAVFIDEMHKENIKLSSFELGKSKIKGEGPNAIVSVEVPDKKKRPRLMDIIREMECVKFVEEL